MARVKKINRIENWTDIYLQLAKNTPEIDMVLSWKLLWMELMLGRKKVDARFVRVLFDGINSMGLIDEKKWSDFSNSKLTRPRLTFAQMFEKTNEWLMNNDVLVNVKDATTRKQKFDKVIEQIPNFKALLYIIYDALPLDLNPKLSEMKSEEETELIRFVYGSIEGFYSVTIPDKEKRTFSSTKFIKLIGFIINEFLYNFSVNDDSPDKLFTKVNNAITKIPSIKHI